MWDEIAYAFPNWFVRLVTYKQYHPTYFDTIYWACDYLFMLGLKLISVSKGAPCNQNYNNRWNWSLWIFCELRFCRQVEIPSKQLYCVLWVFLVRIQPTISFRKQKRTCINGITIIRINMITDVCPLQQLTIPWRTVCVTCIIDLSSKGWTGFYSDIKVEWRTYATVN